MPVIGFPRGAGALYREYARKAGVQCVALDQHVPLGWARNAMPGVALQGNLDPMLMVVGDDALTEAAKRIVGEMAGAPHIFNLGHGITPDASPKHVEQLLHAVRG